jgi:hypothetical protein
MRVFIDSRDLINAFNNSQPIAIDDLATRFRNHGHTLVLSFSLISELVPADNNVIVVLRRFTKIEEDFPHIFLQQQDLPNFEIAKAAAEFAAGSAPSPYDPFVPTFHELWGIRFKTDPVLLMDVDRTIGMRKMSKQIELSLQKPEIFHWQEDEAAQAVAILENEQRAIVTDKPKVVFENTVKRWLRRAGANLAPNQIPQFANMLRQNPRIAPGWRLYIEVFEQLARNKTYRPSVNDVWDLANVTLLPYVDAATLDNNKVQLVKQASQRLRVFDSSINYDVRAFGSIRSLVSTL